MIAEGVIAVALAGVAMSRRRVTTLLVVGVALLLLAVPHAILVWNEFRETTVSTGTFGIFASIHRR